MAELVSFSKGFDGLGDNRVIVNADRSEMKDGAKIVFIGANNILHVADGVCLSRSNIRFCGNNSVVYLSRNNHPYLVSIDIYNNSAVYIGEDCYFNGQLHMIASEQQNIIVGNKCMFSFGIFVRTADPHLIYDCTTKRRINPSASVFIGDHVWIGQNALILKGTKIGSGAIIGGAACVANKRIPSNVSAAGNPVKIVRENVFFLSDCVHSWTDDVAEQYEIKETDDYMYCTDESTVDMGKLDVTLKTAVDSDMRMGKVNQLLANNSDKNRFAIPNDREKKKTGASSCSAYDGGAMSILEVRDVSIRYMTGDFKDIGLKEYILRKLKGNYRVNEFWADKSVSFSLEKGDMLGIIGSNGAGKSTLLKAISGIMEPSRGYVKRNGTVAALLELASGFDGDLTVRENTYLRGAMLGYTRQFMDETYEQIIDFAELKDFQDRPFKQLSSGMKSRLAFSVASLVQPDILILDEVLSVGDGAFRKKSEVKMREIIEGGATTILVSHSLAQIRTMCTKVLWLNKGEQIAFGSNVQEICDQYQAFLEGKKAIKEVQKRRPERVIEGSEKGIDVKTEDGGASHKRHFAVHGMGNWQLYVICAMALMIAGLALMYMNSPWFIMWGVCVVLFCANCWDRRKELGRQILCQFSADAKRNLIYSFCFVFAFTFIAYGFLFANEFFSHDSVQATFYANVPNPFQVCLSVGRFIIPLFEVIKGPYSAPWLIGMFFVMWMGLTCFFVVELFQFKSRLTISLVIGLLCTNTALILTGATYIYCLDEYAVALLAAVMAAYCFCKVSHGEILGSILLIFSLGIYQSYFTVTLALCFIFAMQNFAKNAQAGKVIVNGLKQIGLLLISFGIYFAMWTAMCTVFQVAKLRGTEESILSKGISDIISVLIDSYGGYFRMLLDTQGLLGQAYAVFNTFLIALFLWSLYRFLRKKSICRNNKYVIIALVLCAPLVFSSSKIILAGRTTELTGYVYELIYVFFLVWLGLDEFAKNVDTEKSYAGIVRIITTILIIGIIYNNVLLANQAYMKKDLEKSATISLVTRIIDRVETLEGYSPNDTQVYVVGDLRRSYLDNGNKDVAYLETKAGLWHNFAPTYNLVQYITDYMNYPIRIATNSALANTDEVQNMPAFPAAGSVKMIDGAAVIKLS